MLTSGGHSNLMLSGFLFSWDLRVHCLATLSPRPAATVASMDTLLSAPLNCTSPPRGMATRGAIEGETNREKIC